ncbi:MAG: DUF1553 domain-containing protein [Fimbriimonadaceae bacterium]
MKPTLPLYFVSLTVFGYAASVQHALKPHHGAVNFGRDVRPIISAHCFKCHGTDAAKAAAGLRLDTFAGATKQLGDGAAVAPGDPAKSLLLRRVSEKNADMRMPPPDAGLPALTTDEIAVLRKWILSGAKYAKHWSFVPPEMPAIPAVTNPKWCRNLVDRFVLAKLDAAGLKPEPEADRDTLALRAAETLTGLPPTHVELAAYRRDRKPGAFERLVDKLLADPAYGEQEGRLWLDAVRYGDTHGLQLDNERSVYPYRDWVIRAFNSDLPFNKFAEWQLAGDLLPKPTTEQLVATGYVRMNLTSNEGGAIPEEFLARNTFDRVDTTSTVFLGLTIGCARCHDHKYDPIKQRDYYGLYAYFDSTKDAPLDGNIALPPPVIRASTPAQEAELASFRLRIDGYRRAVTPAAAATWFAAHTTPLPSSRNWEATPVYSSTTFDKAFDTPKPGEPGQPGVAVWKPLKFEVGKDNVNLIDKDNSAIYVRGVVTVPSARTITLAVSSDDGIRLWLNGKLIHSHKVARGLNEGIDDVKADFHAGDNELVAKLVNGTSSDGLNIRLGTMAESRINEALSAYRRSPADSATGAALVSTYLDDGPATPGALAYRKLVKQRADFEATIPMTLIAQEMPTPRPTFILKRGQYDQKGERVERHIPPALGFFPAGAPNNRLGFAQWLTAPSNPLVARVFVNRLWQQHFGTGIIKTAEDFGSQGEWPLDQPLLDYLAVSFVKHGWSVKKLNRLIVTSAAFRQSSRISAPKLAKDPENRLICRGPRFRLDAEVIRDKALAAGGLLVKQLGGRGFKPYQPRGLWESSSDPASGTHIYKRDHDKSIYRRSIYMFWKRTSPPPVMTTFDAPLRDTCTVRRSTTDTPLQALTVMNEPAFLEASRAMAYRVLSTPGSDKQRLWRAYDIAMKRPPSASEVSIILDALQRYRKLYDANVDAAKKLLRVGDLPQSTASPAPEQAAWMIVCSTLMNTDEFITLH